MQKLLSKVRRWKIEKLEKRIAPTATATICIDPLGQADHVEHDVNVNEHAAAHAPGHGAVKLPPEPAGGGKGR